MGVAGTKRGKTNWRTLFKQITKHSKEIFCELTPSVVLFFLFHFFQDNKLYHPRRDVCIDRGSANSEHAKVRGCDGRTAQVWEFSKTNDMD